MFKTFAVFLAAVIVAMVSASSVVAGDTWLFTYPLAEYFDISCNYTCYKNHNAYDYDCGTGDAIKAAEDGIATVGWDKDGYGNFITISHSYGYETIYAHLNVVYIQNGQYVAQGSTIGASGCTGDCTGDHLHFEVRQNGTPVDPYNGNKWLWVTNPPQLYSELSYSGTYLSKSHNSTLELLPGTSVDCWINFRCNPPFYWSNDPNSSHYVALHSVASNWTDMEDSPVIAGTGSMLDDDGSTADPNGVARFHFTITAPETPGTYTLRTRVYHPHSGSFITGTETDVTFTIEVVSPPGTSFPSEYTLEPLVGDWDNDGVVEVGAYCINESNVYRDAIFDGVAESSIHFGTSGDTCLVGDLDGNGEADYALYRPSSQDFFGDSNHDGVADITVHFGASGDIPLIGDWNGNGIWTFGVFRPSNQYFYLDYAFDGIADVSIHFGTTGDQPLTGDFNGNGKTSFGVYRPSTQNFYLDNNLDGIADISVHFGASGDQPLLGDWDGNGSASIGVYRPSNNYFYLDYQNDGLADVSALFGASGDIPVIGDWNADGRDNFAVYRPSNKYFYFDYDYGGVEADRSFLFCKQSGLPRITVQTERITPKTFTLFPNHPNPFNPQTTIFYYLPQPTQVKLEIYNILGQKIARLVDDYQEAGQHTVSWVADQYPSGIYFYCLTTDLRTETKKMVLLR